jgi:hypothetical protein
MSSVLSTLRLIRAKPYTRDECILSDQLYSEFCNRPQHRNRLTQRLCASLRAAANRVARYGNPPGYNARLAYRMHKKRKAKALALAIYGDPLAKCSLDAMDPIPKP